MRAFTVRIENWDSKYFPFIARWKQNGTGYSAVFETKEQLRSYFNNRYYPGRVRYNDYTGLA